MSSMIDEPQVFQQLLAPLIKARRIVVFTGAGMSAESGIAAFKDKPESLWTKFSTREMAHLMGGEKTKTEFGRGAKDGVEQCFKQNIPLDT